MQLVIFFLQLCNTLFEIFVLIAKLIELFVLQLDGSEIHLASSIVSIKLSCGFGIDHRSLC